MDLYMGTIIPWPANYAPEYWMFCDGTILPISQFSALYAVIGSYYGGDGHSTFALPDLRGRVPVGAGNGPNLTPRGLGEKGGQETVTLVEANIPIHAHVIPANNSASDTGIPGPGKVLGVSQTPQRGALNLYTATTANTSIAATGGTGGSQAHPNVQPYLALNYIICVNGLFPPHQS